MTAKTIGAAGAPQCAKSPTLQHEDAVVRLNTPDQRLTAIGLTYSRWVMIVVQKGRPREVRGRVKGARTRTFNDSECEIPR